jgi:hypothetical protein
VTVNLPQNTPADNLIYMASELFTPEWTPDDEEGLLEREGNVALGTVNIPNFTNLAFKFTRGAWHLAEVNTDCSERPNRFTYIQCDGTEPMSIEATVVAWQGEGGDCP